MLITVLLFFEILFPTHALDIGYFYFGNSNLIGIGSLEDGQKSGEWKVYFKTNPEKKPQSSLLQADPLDFEKNFKKEFPIYLINFEQGIPNGSYLENYPNGKPKIIANMQEGIFEGEFGEFYESGELRLSGRVLGGKKEGEWKEYLESGKVIFSIFYDQGVVDGNAIGYYPEGNLKWEGIFRRGNLDGPFVFYRPDSTVYEKGQFAEGVRSGEWLEKLDILPGFYRKGNYRDGLKEGEWQLADLEGKFLQSEIYKQGRLISLGKFESPSNIVDKGKVRNGKGQRYFYDEDGNILSNGKISKGIENGVWLFYYPESNRISAKGQLQNSERVGTWYFYSYDGEIIDQTKYELTSGVLESENNQQTGRKQSYIPGISGSPSLDPFNSMQLKMNMMGQFLK